MLESRKLEDVLKLLIAVATVVLLNVVASRVFVQWDLTEEKRFSLSPATKEILAQLEEPVYVEVYLEGDLPPGFLRLRNATREMLEQFRTFSRNRVEFEFVDPDQASGYESRNEFYLDIASKGIQPTDIFLTEGGNRIQKRILPGAVLSYGSREQGVLLLKGNKGAPAQVQLNQSVENLEFALARTIANLTNDDPFVIGVSTGHGELAGSDISGFMDVVEDQYYVRTVDFRSTSYEEYPPLVVIPKPTQTFSRDEVYNLDQYILGGGKVIFLLDALVAGVDSATISLPYALGLDDMLFRYGVRINKDLVMDFQSAPTPVVVGNLGDQPQIQLLPWPFYPLINTYSNLPMVKNLDAVKLAFASSIDTVKATGIRKTPLLYSSRSSRRINAPVRIDLDELKKPLNPESFDQSHIPLGYLLEGAFTSAFQNRPKPEANVEHVDQGVPSKVVVIGDGDLVRNEYNPETGRPMPLGEEYYTRVKYANEDFILNVISYLLDDNGIVLSRDREVVLRPLDGAKLRNGHFKWQLNNIALPLGLLVGLGLTLSIIRRRKYASF